MDSDQVNKVLMAVLFTCLGILSLNIAAGPSSPAAAGQAGLRDRGAGAPGGRRPWRRARGRSPADRGAAREFEPRARRIGRQALHRLPQLREGRPNKVGPNLWNVVGRPKASAPGFNYSAALKGKGGNWTFDELNKFLANPKGYVPGTAMTFAGLPRDTQRADVINYLHKLADKPIDLPRLRQNSRGVSDGARDRSARMRPTGPGQKPGLSRFYGGAGQVDPPHWLGWPSQKRHNPLKRCARLTLGEAACPLPDATFSAAAPWRWWPPP